MYIIYGNRKYHEILNHEEIINIKNILNFNYHNEITGFRVVIIRTDLKLTRYILGEKYSLLDIKTINKFKIDITSIYVTFVCANDNVDILAYLLEWWLKSDKKSSSELKYSGKALDEASKYGHVNVLDWWLNSGLELKYTKDALNWASMNGHVNVLDWWLKANKESALKLQYSENALDEASAYGHVNVLDWWLEASKKSGLELRYSEDALDRSFYNNYLHVIKWWLKSGLVLKYDEYVFNCVSRNGYVNVINQMRNSV